MKSLEGSLEGFDALLLASRQKSTRDFLALDVNLFLFCWKRKLARFARHGPT